MDTSLTRDVRMPGGPQSIGRVAAVNGSQATIELTGRTVGSESPTVGSTWA